MGYWQMSEDINREVRRIMPDGRCPQCYKVIVSTDRNDESRHYYLIKSMIVNNENGEVTGKCARCKTEVEIPVIKMKKQFLIPRKQ